MSLICQKKNRKKCKNLRNIKEKMREGLHGICWISWDMLDIVECIGCRGIMIDITDIMHIMGYVGYHGMIDIMGYGGYHVIKWNYGISWMPWDIDDIMEYWWISWNIMRWEKARKVDVYQSITNLKNSISWSESLIFRCNTIRTDLCYKYTSVFFQDRPVHTTLDIETIVCYRKHNGRISGPSIRIRPGF